MSSISMDDIRRSNRNAGQHWFSPETLRCFGSEVYPQVFGGRFFVTSEQPPFGPRAFSVRRANDDGTIDTIGEFMAYDSLTKAHAAAAHAAAQPNGDESNG